MADKNSFMVSAMPQLERISVRLSRAQLGHLRALSERLQIDQANVIRLAITRLAQWEGIIPPPPGWTGLREPTEANDG